ncbi:hypothetical protein PoB_007039200 [Plakobranchus ocellatus]|uniref:Uncharacterized protein n=1 Tax=Plakobranchus ocellatus TaxID=259542 RepID=A0AAV4DHZ3_9GAST|nr:hypothetical protein PoB_007039200 [Plakobranchus ocellatus]
MCITDLGSRAIMNLAGYLLLSVLVLSTELSSVNAQDQEDECSNGLRTCLNNHVSRIVGNTDKDFVCSVINDFAGCINRMTCLNQPEKDAAIVAIMNDLQKVDVHCEIKANTGSMINALDVSEGVLPQGQESLCVRERQTCSKIYVARTFEAELAANGQNVKQWFCPNLNRFVDCMLRAPCDDADNHRMVRKEIEESIRKTGISCDIIPSPPDDHTIPTPASDNPPHATDIEDHTQENVADEMDDVDDMDDDDEDSDEDSEGEDEEEDTESEERTGSERTIVEIEGLEGGGKIEDGMGDESKDDQNWMGDDDEDNSDEDDEDDTGNSELDEGQPETDDDKYMDGEKEENREEEEGESEQAEATIGDPHDSAYSTLLGNSSLTLLLSIFTFFSLWLHH